MVCRGCYTMLPPEASVCHICGKEPPSTPCAKCKTSVQEGKRFCHKCRSRMVPLSTDKEEKTPEKGPSQQKCHHCHQLIPSYRRYCRNCGTRQEGVPLRSVEMEDIIPPRPQQNPREKSTTSNRLERTRRSSPLPTEPTPRSLRNSGTSPRPPRSTSSTRNREEKTPTQRPPRQKDTSTTKSPLRNREETPRKTTVLPEKSLEKQSTPLKKSSDLPRSTQICPHCKEITDKGRRFCPSCRKRMYPITAEDVANDFPKEKTEISPKITKISPKEGVEKTFISSNTVEDHSSSFFKEEAPKPKPTRRFCPECYSTMTGDICEYCLENPPLPKVNFQKKSNTFSKLKADAQDTAEKIPWKKLAVSVAGLALTLGLGFAGSRHFLLPENQVYAPVEENYTASITPPTPSMDTSTPEVTPNEPPPPTLEPEISPETTTTPSPTANIPQDVLNLYHPILHSYRFGLEYGWTAAEYESAELNPHIAQLNLENATYAFLDLDDNGIPELVVGSSELGSQILDLYTVHQGKLTLMLRSREGEKYVICQDNLISLASDHSVNRTLSVTNNLLTIINDQRVKDPNNITDPKEMPYQLLRDYTKE